MYSNFGFKSSGILRNHKVTGVKIRLRLKEFREGKKKERLELKIL